jgi:hypothetical protein
VKIKTKYNLGDYVKTNRYKEGLLVGVITDIDISACIYKREFEIIYTISILNPKSETTSSTIELEEWAIDKKLNKKTVDKYYDELCIKEVLKSQSKDS